MEDVLIVDGANVVGSRPDGWWRDRPGAAHRLHRRLTAAGLDPADVVLVLEGTAKAGVPADDQRVRVVHARGSGDDAIVDEVVSQLAGDSGRDVVVVTADRELRDRVVDAGGRTEGPGWLLGQL